MTRSDESAQVLAEECEGAIESIKQHAPTTGCVAHEPLARGVIVLLRCQAAQLRGHRPQSKILNGVKMTALWLGTIVIVAVISAGLGRELMELIGRIVGR